MKCPACKTTELKKAKTRRHGFHMEYCPDCKGIWFERIEIDRILLKLNEIEVVVNEHDTENQETHKPVKEEGHSPILESIYANKELHHLHKLKGRPHWIHRLFD